MDREGRNRVFEFFAKEHKKFKNYVQRKIQSISDMDAEDIVGEVMLSLFNKAEISGNIENLAAYVYRSLYNKSIDYLRKNSRTVSLQSCINEDGETTLMEFLTDISTNVYNETEKKEFLNKLVEAIGNLEPRQRAVFVATEIKGQTFRELSDQWNEPIGTLLSRKCRAVRVLRETLKDYQV